MIRHTALGILFLTLTFTDVSGRPVMLGSEGPSRTALYRASRLTLASQAPSSTKTLAASSLQELIKRTAPVSQHAPLRHASFEAYWGAANLHGQRSGKTFEAILAWRANQQAARGGLPNRFLVTAAEGYPWHPADLIEVGSAGQHVASYQAKLRLNLESASHYLVDPRYEGMHLVTTRESYRRIVQELATKEDNADRRSIALALHWQRVRDSLDSGVIPSQFGGKPLPPLRRVSSLARKASYAQFTERLGTSSRRLIPVPRLMLVLGSASRPLVLGDLAVTGYLQYTDTGRYLAGEVQSDYYAARTGLRMMQASLATYALITPEPMSKIGSTFVVILLTGLDIGLEIAQVRRETAAQLLLEQIDRAERYHLAMQCLTIQSAEPGS